MNLASPVSDRALRILMVSHVPLVPELGAGRVQLELGEELRRLGHHVVTFEPRDAFSSGPRRRDLLFPGRFAAAACAFVRERGHAFDVVDAHHGCLPFTKPELAFDGLLVARSSGLFAFYQDFERYERATWPDLLPGSVPGRLLRRWRHGRDFVQCRRSLEYCDLALLLTDDEVSWATRELGAEDRWFAVPNGVADGRAEALAHSRRAAAERLARREVVAIGRWSLRKGAADWPAIIGRVRERVESVRFRFLGTGAVPHTALGDGVTIVPSFRSDELPGLLAGATVGALPTYAEGWGLGILEQLAAGIPTVAYDVSGPRAMLGRLGDRHLAPRGDAAGLADRIADVLLMDESTYGAHSVRSLEIARRFRWSAIAQQTAQIYAAGLERLRLPRAA